MSSLRVCLHSSLYLIEAVLLYCIGGIGFFEGWLPTHVIQYLVVRSCESSLLFGLFLFFQPFFCLWHCHINE